MLMIIKDRSNVLKQLDSIGHNWNVWGLLVVWPRLLGITLSATSSAREKGHKPKRALERLTEMQWRGLEPNVSDHIECNNQRIHEGTVTWTYACAADRSVRASAKTQRNHIQRDKHRLREETSSSNALELLTEMEGRGLEPDLSTHDNQCMRVWLPHRASHVPYPAVTDLFASPS